MDFGQWNIASSWNEVTLKQFQELERLYKSDNANLLDIIAILSNHSRDEVEMLPVMFLDKLVERIAFLDDEPTWGEPSNELIINGERFAISPQQKMRAGEYIAVTSMLNSDETNYAAILAILCRKKDEPYTTTFENEVLPDRIKLFENASIIDAMGVCFFFINLWTLLELPTQLCSQVEEAIEHIRKHLETLTKNGELSERSMKSAVKKLQKLRKSIKFI